MTEQPDAPVLRVLARPVVAGRYTTIDFEELRLLVDDTLQTPGPYAAGVRDTLRWLADGYVTPELLQLLGDR